VISLFRHPANQAPDFKSIDQLAAVYSRGCHWSTSVKRRLLAFALLVAFAFESVTWAGLNSKKALYVGGTIPSLAQGTEGTASAQDEKIFVFDYKGGKLSIPYEKINDLEYGEKAGRRLGLAIVVSPLFLFSKKKKHFLTLGYTDDNDKQEAGVFELGKDVIRVTLASLEARTGRKVDYQDEEARKDGLGGS
jgi:hypothetical protein